MKKLYQTIALVCATFMVCTSIKAQNTFPATGSAGIGTTAPGTSSLLEIKSTTKGVLMPRMTAAQRDAIASPATGLLIYQINSSPGFYYFDGNSWQATGGANISLSNLASPTLVNAHLQPDSAGKRNLGAVANAWNNIYFHGGWYKDNTLIFTASSTNFFFGTNAGKNNTGNYNTCFGAGSLVAIRAANFNTAVGYNALHADSTGSENTAVGELALAANIGGNDNVAVGISALSYNTSGYQNTATGAGAMFYNTTGYANIATGYEALIKNNSGYRNIAIGANAQESNLTGADNVAIGDHALDKNTDADGNVAIGTNALFTNKAVYNVAIGFESLKLNSTGFRNSALGYQSLASNTTGSFNTATGNWALTSNTTGSTNTAIGESALAGNTKGHSNVALGAYALSSITSSSNLVAVGDSALLQLSGSTGHCTAVGSAAGLKNTTGGNNTYVGYHAGNTVTTGASNTLIGYGADINAGNLVNATALGNLAVVGASNRVRIGNTSVTSIGGQVGWTNFSDERIKTNIQSNVPGLVFINLLKPVTYNFNIDKQENIMGLKSEAQDDQKYDIQKIQFTGFVAQDVEAAAKRINYNFSGIDAPKNNNDIYGLRYADFVVPLVKAVQELSKMNDDKDAKIDDLQKQIDDLRAMIAGKASQATNNNAMLGQNIPNPSTNTTNINYSFPQKFSSAQLVITDNTGRVLKQVTLTGAGKGNVNIDTSAFASGSYQYSLYIDGQFISSKQMLLAR